MDQLDQCAKDFTFPMLDNGVIYPVDSRMTVYRDDFRWALIIEVVGFNYRGGGHYGISNCLHIFGNCLDYPPGTNNDNFLYFTANSDEGDAFDPEFEEYLNPDTTSMLIREQKIPINHDFTFYQQLGIELEDPPKIMIWEFLRGLVPVYRKEMLATENEIRTRIPEDLPLFIQLDEWNHIDLADGQMPSQSETFRMIAKAIVSGKITDYRPTVEPNNHWSNWPDGGTL